MDEKDYIFHEERGSVKQLVEGERKKKRERRGGEEREVNERENGRRFVQGSRRKRGLYMSEGRSCVVEEAA